MVKTPCAIGCLRVFCVAMPLSWARMHASGLLLACQLSGDCMMALTCELESGLLGRDSQVRVFELCWPHTWPRPHAPRVPCSIHHSDLEACEPKHRHGTGRQTHTPSDSLAFWRFWVMGMRGRVGRREVKGGWQVRHLSDLQETVDRGLWHQYKDKTKLCAKLGPLEVHIACHTVKFV